MQTYSEKIKALRAQNSLTQEQLAQAVGVSRQMISRWEKGWNVPSFYYAQKLAQIFNVNVDYLMADLTQEEAEEKRQNLDEQKNQSKKGITAIVITLSVLPIIFINLFNFFIDWFYNSIVASWEGVVPVDVILTKHNAYNVNNIFCFILSFAILVWQVVRATLFFKNDKSQFARYNEYKNIILCLFVALVPVVYTTHDVFVTGVSNPLVLDILATFFGSVFLSQFLVLLFDLIFRKVVKNKGLMTMQTNEVLNKINFVFIFINGTIVILTLALLICSIALGGSVFWFAIYITLNIYIGLALISQISYVITIVVKRNSHTKLATDNEGSVLQEK